jgi:hypothetical protein
VSDSEDDRVTSVQSHRVDGRLRYRLLTGPATVVFCERVSEALADGYVLYGSPSLTFDGTTRYVAQAVVLADTAVSPTNDE